MWPPGTESTNVIALVLVPSSGNLVGTLIAAGGRDPIVHIAIDMGDGTVIEERGNGLTRSPATVYDSSFRRWALSLTPEQEQEMHSYLVARLVLDAVDRQSPGPQALRYDYLQVVLDGWNLLTGQERCSPLKGRADCSGIAAEACAAVGYWPMPFPLRLAAAVRPDQWHDIVDGRPLRGGRLPDMSGVVMLIPRPYLLLAESVGVGVLAAGGDAVQTHLLNATSVPTLQTVGGWFVAGALSWAVANLRSTYATLLAGGTKTAVASPVPTPR